MATTNEAFITVNNIAYTLSDVEKDCWLRLLNGSLKSKDAFHLASVANFSNGEISQRTVVLRKVLPQEKLLRFHTDIRSNKWTSLQENNVVSMLFYDAAARIQIRIKGFAVLQYADEIANDAWEKTNVSSRRCYLATVAPSSISELPTSGLQEQFELKDPTIAESEAGKINFGVVSVQAQSIDWLWLHHAGHRRAFFDYGNGQSTWLIP